MLKRITETMQASILARIMVSKMFLPLGRITCSYLPSSLCNLIVSIVFEYDLLTLWPMTMSLKA